MNKTQIDPHDRWGASDSARTGDSRKDDLMRPRRNEISTKPLARRSRSRSRDNNRGGAASSRQTRPFNDSRDHHSDYNRARDESWRNRGAGAPANRRFTDRRSPDEHNRKLTDRNENRRNYRGGGRGGGSSQYNQRTRAASNDRWDHDRFDNRRHDDRKNERPAKVADDRGDRNIDTSQHPPARPARTDPTGRVPPADKWTHDRYNAEEENKAAENPLSLAAYRLKEAEQQSQP